MRSKYLIPAAIIAALAVLAFIASSIFSNPVRLADGSNAQPHSQYPLHPSTPRPDNIVLTPTRDMSTAMNVTWRTSSGINFGVVQYRELAGRSPGKPLTQKARRLTAAAPELAADEVIHCFQATMKRLKAGARYQYRVGSPEAESWSSWRVFTTAEASDSPFSFLYFGDTQVHPEKFGARVAEILGLHPEAEFCLVGGDLVDAGDPRNMWDALLSPEAWEVLSSRPLVPSLGNHDVAKRGLKFYKAYFNLSTEDPQASSKPKEGVFDFFYNGVHFIVLNSNESDSSGQTRWLARVLEQGAEAKADFTIIMFHHPPYRPRSEPGAIT